MPRLPRPQILDLGTYAHAYCSPRQLGEYFGFSTMTVIRWCKNGRVKALKVGHDWRIPTSEARAIEARIYQPRKSA